MTMADLEAALMAARERNRAGGAPPLCGVWAARRSNGAAQLVSLPAVAVAQLRRATRDQLLTGVAWQLAAYPHLVRAETPINQPHRADRGIPCALCDVFDAHHLRRDQRGWPGIVCDDCAERVETKTRMWPQF